MKQFAAETEITKIRIDKNSDIIPITVGLYKFFMANGKEGRDAKDLYEHLIFTARLQETNQIKANNIYLANGLCWGENRVKKAKAFLATHGLIEYVQVKDSAGQFGYTVIRLRFLINTQALSEKMQGCFISEDEPAPKEEIDNDLQLDLPGLTVGIETIPTADASEELPVGIETVPPANRTCGDDGQMLKASNQMLETENLNDVCYAQNKDFFDTGQDITGIRNPVSNEYVKQCFEIMKSMPQRRVIMARDEISFMMQDFYKGYELIKNMRLHSDEVLQALRNVKAVLELPDSWYQNSSVSFKSICRGIESWLPDRFDIERYKKAKQSGNTHIDTDAVIDRVLGGAGDS
ncbi:hypothetical protein K7I13_12075 [Brucepastera parasyntrophica]|uniref:hypothetical protein n=1 Tax=Brucepastera parasyntrophica TaxID=2880008 RepID=UPI0021099F06|nr:hypothetical protein [Brucepastera parasyntrophica]ULQ59224.1 hypothetical protein K7I13_12075 [Brucepastera parasyntrophica]